MPFEPQYFDAPEKPRVIKKPSYDRVTVAITLTIVVMVLCAIVLSIYTDKYVEKNDYFPMGEFNESQEYREPDRFGGYVILGKPVEILEFTNAVVWNNMATLRIQGEPGAEYDITVFLKSGPSTNSKLIPKTADEHGVVEWEWKVYSRTSPGDFRVVVTRMGEGNVCLTYAELTLTVIKKD